MEIHSALNIAPLHQVPIKEDLSGDFTFTLYQVSEPLVSKVVALRSLLDKLNLINNPPPVPIGFCGGPGAIHPWAYREEIKEIQKYFHEVKAPRSDDQLLIKQINLLMDKFITAYEASLGSTVYYPGLGNDQIRFVDANGNEVSQKEFDKIKNNYLEALNDALESVKSLQRSLNCVNV